MYIETLYSNNLYLSNNMEANKDDPQRENSNQSQNTQRPTQGFQRPKLSGQQQEKTNLTSYSFARNKDEPASGDSITTPPLASDDQTHQNYMPMPPQMAGMPPSGYGQMPPHMMNYAQPAPSYGPMYPHPMKGGKAVLTSASPNHPMIPFHDIQFMHDASGNNTPTCQVDPSPTAETLIPGFLKDEFTNSQVPVPPGKPVPVQTQRKQFTIIQPNN